MRRIGDHYQIRRQPTCGQFRAMVQRRFSTPSDSESRHLVIETARGA
jgi:hypothetical protein